MLSRKILLAGQGAGGGGGGGGGGGTGAYYGYTSGAAAATNTITPGLVNTYYRRAIIAFLYTSSELTNFGLSSNDVITKLRWNVTQTPLQNRMPFPNYAIRMMHIGSGTTLTNPTNLGGLSSSNVTDVKAQHNYDAYTPGTGMHEMTLDNSFTWNGTDAIGFIFAWGQVPTNWNARGTTTQVNSGRLYYNWSDQTGTYTVTDTAVTSQNYRPAIDMFAT